MSQWGILNVKGSIDEIYDEGETSEKVYKGDVEGKEIQVRKEGNEYLIT